MPVSQTEAPVTDKATTQTPPAGSDAGQGGSNTKAPSYKFKTQEEAEKSYQELEKKFGEHSQEVEAARKFQEDSKVVFDAIWSDPDLYRAVETGIKKRQNGAQLPETKPTVPKKGDEEASVINNQVSEIKKTQENKILNDFYAQFGYRNLGEKEFRDATQNLSLTLAEIVDPSGQRPIREVLNNIPLSKLPRFLEHAHKIANYNMAIGQAKKSALSQVENEDATIGSFAASSGQGRGNAVTLTNRERETARKMGIKEEDYLASKTKILKERSE